MDAPPPHEDPRPFVAVAEWLASIGLSAPELLARDALFAKVRRAIERVNTRGLRDALKEFAPDHIICTHFLPAELLAHDIKRGRAVPPVWVQVTDFDLHRMWVQAGMRGYFAASDEIATVRATRSAAFEAERKRWLSAFIQMPAILCFSRTRIGCTGPRRTTAMSTCRSGGRPPG